MERGWGQHTATIPGTATAEVDQALQWLKENEGRDALLLVHVMDPHLPYREPAPYDRRYTDVVRPPQQLKMEFGRKSVTGAHLRSTEDRQYMRDRYDQNVAYAHDEIGRLLASTTEKDLVVYFSDHGEEFWEHGDFEHGHTLHDEVLRVPFILKGPGVTPGRFKEPVSTLDLVPTLLEALDLPAAPTRGMSVLPLLNGDPTAPGAFENRTLGFGRMLYGVERWGVLSQGSKYITAEGRESLYAVEQDPREKLDLWEGKPADPLWRTHLSTAVDQPTSVVFRVVGSKMSAKSDRDVIAHIVVPGGVREFWPSSDPGRRSDVDIRSEGDSFEIKWKSGFSGGREIFFVPNQPIGEVGPHIRIENTDRNRQFSLRSFDSAEPRPSKRTLANYRDGDRSIAIGLAVGVKPQTNATPLPGRDEEVEAALKALGYVFDD